MSDKIPKIIHQLWIGSKPAPTNHMDTWKHKHPDFEYIRWNESELQRRDMKLECQHRIDEMEEINGKADIIRWEILYKYGGIFLDADSICIEPVDDTLTNCKSFAGWEQEQVRQGLIATGTMGFPPKHPLVYGAIEWIKENCVNVKKTGMRAWQTVGPGLLTRMYNTGRYKDLTIFPSYSFLPIHCTGLEYKGHGKIYAYQEWGSTKQNYEIMNSLSLPPQFLTPSVDSSVSVLVSSLNTKALYLQQCLDSIKHQQGLFHIELIWINDGSDLTHTKILKRMLEQFETTTRFVRVVYIENDENKGIGYTLNKGIRMCRHEIIIKMDSDDIMTPDRIIKQLTYMNNNPHVKMCGGQVQMFDDNMNNRGKSNHPSLSWDDYKRKPSHWFINHPTVCYRKSAVLEAGNYDERLEQMCEDFELELRMLKTHGYIYNFPDVLLNYRLHDKQVTHNGGEGGKEKWHNIRMNIINTIVS
jgi:GT2 family glycosyltransferase